MWLFIIFVLVPIIEIALFIQLGGALGFWPTILIVILTAFLGSTLIRSQGMQAMARLQTSLQGQDDPVDSLVHGFLILVAGIVLVTPGFFTDALGLSLMIPQVRSFLIEHFSKHIAGSVQVSSFGGFGPGQSRPQRQPQDPDIIEGEYTHVDAGNSPSDIEVDKRG